MMTPRKRQFLTDREKQLVKLAMHDLSNSQIAKIMDVSENTIKYELAIIYDKLRIRNKAELYLPKK
jgi:DNA-binding CsgD family transcriptional regulator